MRGIVIYSCPIFKCGADIQGQKGHDPEFCENCNTPLWPLNEGHTGNGREAVIEFANTHERNGEPRQQKNVTPPDEEFIH